MPERFEIYIVYKRRYNINTLPFLFSFHRPFPLNKWSLLLDGPSCWNHYLSWPAFYIYSLDSKTNQRTGDTAKDRLTELIKWQANWQMLTTKRAKNGLTSRAEFWLTHSYFSSAILFILLYLLLSINLYDWGSQNLIQFTRHFSFSSPVTFFVTWQCSYNFTASFTNGLTAEISTYALHLKEFFTGCAVAPALC